MAAFFSSSSSSSSFVPLLIRSVLFVSLVSGAFLFDSGEAGAAHRVVDPEWHPATATWYGSPDGDGSDATKWAYARETNLQAKFCTVCYHGLDELQSAHLRPDSAELTGAAFGRLAVAGHGGQLRNRGEISVVYRRTACKYGGKNIAFHVNEGSTSFWLSLLVEFEDGDGDIGSMQLKQANSVQWQEMKHIWGATWSLTPGPLVGPFSVRLTTLTTKQALSAQDVIPKNWTPKATYTSRLNFS
ncbi:hypothetical protein ABZP36_032730 [Zizania latifolia]